MSGLLARMSEPSPSPLTVELGDRSYPVFIGSGLLGQAGELLRSYCRHSRTLLVTDQNLFDAGHCESLRDALASAGLDIELFVRPPGEASKSFASYQSLIEDMLSRGIERNTSLIAFGGGVIGDLTGFAAASALRGLDYIQIPTTLLAQVDSSVGGKTGINSTHGKNLIGAFHQPKAVLIDVDMLQTLPLRERRAGYAEVIKYGCIYDRSFFEWLESHGANVLDGDQEAQIHAIRRSVEIKAAIVRQDERETSGKRALLNFGHTFAHAYEAITGYGNALLHGEAVSLGMVKAADLSSRLGLAGIGDRDRLRQHLDRLELPTSPRRIRNQGFAAEAMMAAMQRDKKVEAGQIRFILWRGIGEAFPSSDVDATQLHELLQADG